MDCQVKGTEMECKDIQHVRELMSTHLTYMTAQVDEAKRLMEGRMADFPVQFVRSGEMATALSKIMSDMDTLKEFMHRAQGLATQRSLEVVRWVSIVSFLMGLLGLLLRYMKI